jgi:hypothetical protein
VRTAVNSTLRAERLSGAPAVSTARLARRVRSDWGGAVAITVAGAVLLAGCGNSAKGAQPSSGASAAASVAASASTSQGEAVSPRPVPRRTVAPPSPGSIHQKVATTTAASLKPVPLTGTARYGGGVTGLITEVSGVDAKAQGPGEVAGPAVQVTVRIDNGSTHRISLGDVVVNVYNAANDPGVPVSTYVNQSLRGSLAPGRHANGTYAFTLPLAGRNPVTVSVSYSPAAPIALFVGSVK